MANILSEPSLPNAASRSEEVLLERTSVPMSQLALDAKAAAEKNPTDPELWIKYGRALRRQMMHREAIEAYCLGITYNPFYALLYRHRAHAYINIGEYTVSAATFEIALRLDPQNWDCWYHQGLAYYLMGDYARAEKSLEGCFRLEDEMAARDWLWLTRMRLGKAEEAAQAVADVRTGEEEKHHKGYYNRVLVYAGKKSPEEVMAIAETLDEHMYATYGYGVACWYVTQGQKEKALPILRRIAAGESWSGFAEQAARRDLAAWEE